MARLRRSVAVGGVAAGMLFTAGCGHNAEGGKTEYSGAYITTQGTLLGCIASGSASLRAKGVLDRLQIELPNDGGAPWLSTATDINTNVKWTDARPGGKRPVIVAGTAAKVGSLPCEGMVAKVPAALTDHFAELVFNSKDGKTSLMGIIGPFDQGSKTVSPADVAACPPQPDGNGGQVDYQLGKTCVGYFKVVNGAVAQ